MNKMSKTFGFGGSIMMTILVTAPLAIAVLAVLAYIIMQIVFWQSVTVRENGAQPVIEALENYKKDKGYYPESIKLLELGGYIKSSLETEFHYDLLDSGKYTLCFGTDLIMVDTNPACDFECYSPVSRQWEPGNDKDNPTCR